jgi:hypothetical protein
MINKGAMDTATPGFPVAISGNFYTTSRQGLTRPGQGDFPSRPKPVSFLLKADSQNYCFLHYDVPPREE